MKAFRKMLRRRDFLEWLALAGLGSASGISFGLPLREKAGAEEDHLVSHKQAGSLPTENPGFHVFSKHLQFLDYQSMAEAAAEIGFDGIELTVRPGGHVLPERVAEDLPKAVEAIHQQGLKASMIATAISDAGDLSSRKVLEVASQLGIKYYRTDWLRYDEQKSIEENLARFNQTLGSLAILNQELGITGDYQNHAGFGGHLLGSPVWDLAAVLDEISSAHMGCQYDIRHATVEGGTSWPLGLKRVAPHIHTLVLKDFKWGKKAGQWQIINTPIGEGMVDFKQFFSLLKTYGISVPMSVHFEFEMPEYQQGLSKKELRRQTIRLMQQDLNKLKAYRKEVGLE